MRRLIIIQSEADITSHAGRGLIGMVLNECTDLAADAEAVSPLRSDTMSHANIVSSYIAHAHGVDKTTNQTGSIRSRQ